MQLRRREGLRRFPVRLPTEWTCPMSDQKLPDSADHSPSEVALVPSVGRFPYRHIACASDRRFVLKSALVEWRLRGIPWPQSTSTCRNFVTISSGLCRLIPISDPPFPNYTGGPLQRGRISRTASPNLGSPIRIRTRLKNRVAFSLAMSVSNQEDRCRRFVE